MAGIVGVTTGKFLLAAATLCLPIRIDREKVQAVIDADVPVSVMSVRMARHLHLVGPTDPDAGVVPMTLHRPIHVSIGAEGFPLDTVAISQKPFADGHHAGADIILGRDMLENHVVAIDFAKKVIRIVLPAERFGAERGLDPIRLETDAQGARLIRLRIGNAPPVDARLDLGSETAIALDGTYAQQLAASGDISDAGHGRGSPFPIARISLGNLAFADISAASTSPWPSVQPVEVGLGFFARSRVVLDLPHGTIWVSRGTGVRAEAPK